MNRSRTIISLSDYERIFRVIYSVIDEHANTQHACLFFAVVGAAILELKYKIQARPIAGAAAFCVHGSSSTVSTFGKIVDADLVSAEDAFHCWVQAGNIAIDFMAPLFRESFLTYGHDVAVPRRMFQKPMIEMAQSFDSLYQEGMFILNPNIQLTTKLIEFFFSRPAYRDLAEICLAWYAKPPKKLPTGVSVKDDEGRIYLLKPIGPEITGVW